ILANDLRFERDRGDDGERRPPGEAAQREAEVVRENVHVVSRVGGRWRGLQPFGGESGGGQPAVRGGEPLRGERACEVQGELRAPAGDGNSSSRPSRIQPGARELDELVAEPSAEVARVEGDAGAVAAQRE